MVSHRNLKPARLPVSPHPQIFCLHGFQKLNRFPSMPSPSFSIRRSNSRFSRRYRRLKSRRTPVHLRVQAPNCPLIRKHCSYYSTKFYQSQPFLRHNAEKFFLLSSQDRKILNIFRRFRRRQNRCTYPKTSKSRPQKARKAQLRVSTPHESGAKFPFSSTALS